MASYHDFSITFGPRSGNGYTVTAKSARSGTVAGTFDPPVALDQLPSMLYSATRAGVSAGPMTRGLDRAPATPPQDLGAKLFDALFAGTVRDCFVRSLVLAQKEDAVLRVRLSMDLNNESVRPLATIPWELLRNDRKALVQWPATALVRSPNVFCSSERTPFTFPLRVLFVMANPRNDLKLDVERAEIETRVKSGSTPIDAVWLENASVRSLERTLHDGDFHIVHFMGHGAVDQDGGVLLMHRDGQLRQEERVSASEIGRLLLGEPSVRLVVLNACRTAESAQGVEVDAYTGGVATALLVNEVPAVIAMQAPISDGGAADFADRLYSMLADGETIEKAVREGRQAIRDEWAIPVLFSQWEGPLFPRPDAPAAPAVVPNGATAPVSAAVPRFEASPGAIATLADLLPYLVDRSEVLKHLALAVKAQDATPARPLVAIISGDDSQALDMLAERLEVHELPKKLLRLTNSDPLKSYPFQWPRQCSGRGALHEGLTSAIAGASAPLDTPEKLQRYLCSNPGPVMLYSIVLSSEWYSPKLVEDYIDYWTQWPVAVAPTRLLVFLFVKYTVPEAGGLIGGFMAKRQAKKMNDAIAATLAALSTATRDAVILCVPPTLGGVKEQDVTNWNLAHGRPLKEHEITMLYRAHAGGKMEMPMVTIAPLLKQLMDERAHASGGAR